MISFQESNSTFNPTVEWLDGFMRRFCLSNKKKGIYSKAKLKLNKVLLFYLIYQFQILLIDYYLQLTGTDLTLDLSFILYRYR